MQEVDERAGEGSHQRERRADDVPRLHAKGRTDSQPHRRRPSIKRRSNSKLHLDFLHRRSKTCFENFVRCKEEWMEKNPGRAYPSIDEVIIDPKTGKTYKIGFMDSHVRNANCFNAKEDPERKAVLDKMGMVWNVMDAREEFWLNETKWFKNEYGNINPSKISDDLREAALGEKHVQIRCQNTFDILTDASKLKKWKEAGFIPDLAEHAMEPLFEELEKECPDLRISNPEIGNLVNNIRSKGIHVRGNRDFLKKLHKKGFKMHAMDSAENAKRWRQILSGRLTCDDWEKYYKTPISNSERKRKMEVIMNQ